MSSERKLSYTMFSSWEKDPMEWYLKYEVGAPRLAQTEPMSVGSAFDAFVKSYLYKEIFGSVSDEYDRDALFESQVEKHNRDFARTAGEHCFKEYKAAGRCAYLLSLMEQSDSAPVFERRLEQRVSVMGNDIMMVGYPDLRFVTKSGIPCIVDWKVNGYCSRGSVSPEKGYVKCVDCASWDGRASREVHPKAVVGYVDGIAYSRGPFLQKWKDQLCMYNWMLGGSVGQNAILMIEQIAGGKQDSVPTGASHTGPPLRCANHSVLVGAEAQETLAKRIVHMWVSVESGYVFRSLTRSENDREMAKLKRAYGTNDKDGVFSALTRKVRNW